MGLEEYKPVLVMVGCQFLYSGIALSGRAVLLDNMSSRVFVFYRQCFAFLLIAPLAFFSRCGKKDSGLGWKSLWMISLLSFIGVTVNQNMYYEGLYLASSSVASALTNLVPAITFILAYTFGLEKVNLRSIRSVAKILGTVFCVGGAAAMALLKGPKLLNVGSSSHSTDLSAAGQDTWFVGCLFLFGSAFCWSFWLILQVQASAQYPDHLCLTAWMCLMAAIQSGTWAFLAEPDMDAWKLSSPFQVFSCFFAGFASAVTFYGQAWCTTRRGPLFAALFNPLCTVIVTVFACIFMHEELYTGSMMGGLVVIIGLYIVLWGKSRDNNQEMFEEDTSQLKSDQVSSQVSSCIIIITDLEEPLLLSSVDLEDPHPPALGVSSDV